MPLYDWQCETETCGRIFELYRSLTNYQDAPPCPDCAGVTGRAYLPSGAISSADPVVVFKAPDGTFRFPGDPNGLSAASYAKQGLERVELRGWAEVRRFESHMNKSEYSSICQRMERVARGREEGDAIRSSEIRRGLEQGFAIPDVDSHGQSTGRTRLVRMTTQGRALMEAARRKSQGRPLPKAYTPNFHVEAYSYDRSSRDESRDRDGRRRRD